MVNMTDFNETDMQLVNASSREVIQWRGSTRIRALQPWSIEIQICIGILCATVTLIGILANSVVLYSYITTDKLRTYANYFVFGLALVDLTDVTTVLPLLSIYFVFGFWPFSKAACEMFKFASHTVGHTSYLFTLVICIDRYRALTQPLKHMQERTKRRAVSMMMIACLIPVMSWIGPIIIWPTFGKNVPRQYISTLCYPHYSRVKIFALFSSAYIALLPMSLICILYTLVYRAFRQRLDAVRKSSNRTAEKHVNSLKSQAFTKLSVVSHNAKDTDVINHTGQENMGFKSDDTDQKDESPAHPIPRREDNIVQTEIKRARPVSMVSSKRNSQDKIEEQNLKATKVLSMIVIVMLIARLPWGVISLYATACGPTCLPVNLSQVSKIR